MQLDTATTLRRCIVELEKRIPPCLLTPGWSTERQDWGKTVMAAADVSSLAAALVLLMEAIKPAVCLFRLEGRNHELTVKIHSWCQAKVDAWLREGTLRESLLSSLVPDQSDVRRGAKRGRRPLPSTIIAAAALAAMDPTKAANRKFETPQQQRLAEDPTKGWMWCHPQVRSYTYIFVFAFCSNLARLDRAARLRM
jgi:hypothetical protein